MLFRSAVHGVPKSRTRLSDFTFTFHFHALEKEMATHSSGKQCGKDGLESETVINVHPKFRIEVTTVHAGGDGEKG